MADESAYLSLKLAEAVQKDQAREALPSPVKERSARVGQSEFMPHAIH